MSDKFLEYKGKPLVRNGNTIYYGDMGEKYVIKLEILSTKKSGDAELADKVRVELVLSDPELRAKDKAVKQSEKTGLYEAMDIGAIWLERALKQ